MPNNEYVNKYNKHNIIATNTLIIIITINRMKFFIPYIIGLNVNNSSYVNENRDMKKLIKTIANIKLIIVLLVASDIRSRHKSFNFLVITLTP